MGTTTNHGLRYPESINGIAIPSDIKKLADDVDAKLISSAGGTITGNVSFTGITIVPTPTANNHAATKLYVDNSISSINTELTRTAHPSSTTDNAIARYDGTTGKLQGSGMIVSDGRAVTGVASLTDAAMATATLGAELGDGESLTQNLAGLSIGAVYQVAAVSGTLTAATLDGNALTCYGNTTAFTATATSHTVIGTGGTATAISVKAVTARSNTVAPSIAGVQVSRTTASSIFVGTLPVNLVSTATSNTAVGYLAQNAVVTGGQNTAMGRGAQTVLTTGKDNTAVGSWTQDALTTGQLNTAVGSSAHGNLTTGTGNSAFGASSQTLMIDGTYNTSAGWQSLQSVTSGSFNTALGRSAGQAFTTGSYNLALGTGAGFSGTTATLSGTVCIGTNSSGTAAQVTADNQIVLGTSSHDTIIAGSLEMTTSGKGVIVRSPNGTRYRLGVTNEGTITAVAL